MKKVGKMSPGKRLILILAVIAVLVFGHYAVVQYLHDYYLATATALEAMSGNADVAVWKTDHYYLFTTGPVLEEGEKPSEVQADPAGTEDEPEFAVGTAQNGIIFYPGARVEEKAYAPLACGLAEAGYDVYVMRMPFHMAIFKRNAADIVMNVAESTESWILMGHSMGGAMAASYAAEHADAVDGLVLLAAYSTADLSESEVQVLSIYGENDQVLNRSRYEKYQKNLPEDYREHVIEGGNHAGYGYYGEQKGDGSAGITPREQQNEVVDQIRNMFQ